MRKNMTWQTTLLICKQTHLVLEFCQNIKMAFLNFLLVYKIFYLGEEKLFSELYEIHTKQKTNHKNINFIKNNCCK